MDLHLRGKLDPDPTLEEEKNRILIGPQKKILIRLDKLYPELFTSCIKVDIVFILMLHYHILWEAAKK